MTIRGDESEQGGGGKHAADSTDFQEFMVMPVGAATFAELLSACRELDVKFMVCEMGLRATGLETANLRSDITYAAGGIVTLLAEAEATGRILFV